ncbi:GTPase IMAP family member 7-like [Amphiura filiformis]|uniref:GTPase IMAP family member 7-like n=1 Tax=Amphiura filiformis TaxID=82378 RepID=UPI003B213DBF
MASAYNPHTSHRGDGLYGGDNEIDADLAIALERSRISYSEEQHWEEIKEHVLDESAREDSNKRRFVVIGETGSGKSETSNSILHQRGLFKTSMSATSVTKTCMIEKAEVKDRVISIVDTPGFFDADMDQESLQLEITKCTVMTAPGPHAFFLVIRIGRMSKQVQETVRLFREIFGEKCTEYLVVVFTGRKSLSEVRDGLTIEEYVDTVEKDVADILRDCNNRYVVFENTVDPDSKENEEQVDDLLAVVDDMVRNNGGRHYTNDMLEEAGRKVNEREQD